MTNPLPDFDALWDYQDPKGTEQRFRVCLEGLPPDADASYRAQLLTQIARAQGLQAEFQAAHRTLDEVEKLVPDTSADRGYVRYLLERGRVFNSSGETEQARAYFLQAWELASNVEEDFFAADAAHMMGIVESPEEGIEWNRRALDLVERSPDPRAASWPGALYNNTGWSLHDLGRYEEALDYFRLGLDWRRTQGQARETRIAAWAVGRALRSLGRLDEALSIQQDNLRQAQEAGDVAGYVEEELGECLLALGREEEALPHFALAYDALSKDGRLVDHEPDRLERLKHLGAAAS